MTFLKSQVSAFFGGITDYVVMLYCVEALGIHYMTAICIGGFIGAIVNYSISRYWAFDAREEKIQTQVFKYVLVSLGSIILKSGGTFLLTESTHVDYRITRLLVDGVVALGFNYTLQKFWVFKKPLSNQEL